ncbi:MAG: transporter [Desulfobacterales bacterium]|nr:transporter [Desulfobacterales bacterium]
MEKTGFTRSLPRILCIFCGLWAAGLFLTASAGFCATAGTHYPMGTEGVLAASTPPPGFHYRMYNTFYNPTTLTDDNGDKLDIGYDLDVFASVHRFIHVTEKKFLGADVLYDVIVPVLSKDVSVDALGISDSKSLSVGDITIEPFALSWHQPAWDAVAALAVIAPIGEFDADKPASPGLGYWSGMLTLGGTLFFDEQKTWSASALTRTLVHGRQKDTDIRPGAEFVVEWGIGKEIPVSPGLVVRPGISGCSTWQIDDDSDDGPGTVASERKQNHALGAEINFFFPPPRLMQVNLRFLREFSSKNSPEGSQFIITLSKSW